MGTASGTPSRISGTMKIGAVITAVIAIPR